MFPCGLSCLAGRQNLHKLRIWEWHSPDDLSVRESAILSPGPVPHAIPLEWAPFTCSMRYNEECGMGKECAEASGKWPLPAAFALR